MPIQKRILVVDDEQDIVVTLTRILRRQGFDVVSASDGEQALERVKDSHPDLVILDIEMPKLNGIEVLQRIKGESQTASLPVIMLTAKAGDEDMLKGYKFGADYYITKPFKMTDVLDGMRMIFQYKEEKKSRRFKI